MKMKIAAAMAFLAKDWDDAMWQKELGYLKEAGMHYIVLFASAEKVDGKIRTIYPTKLPGCEIY